MAKRKLFSPSRSVQESMSAARPHAPLALVENVAARIREQIVGGHLRPGTHLSEQALSKALQVSRNSLREVFRQLAAEGLVRHELNRGVFVATPDLSTIIDIYKIRRLIEIPAVSRAYPNHPAIERMEAALALAQSCREQGDWMGVGSADIAFHAAIVALADSSRLSAFFAKIAFELRLVFGLVQTPEHFHAPFIEQNDRIAALLRGGDMPAAAQALEEYLDQAERVVRGAYGRLQPAEPEPALP